MNLDGNDFWIRRETTFFRDGKPQLKLWLIPIEAVKKRLQIKDEELDTSEDPDGIIVKTYPLAKRLILSPNPERQRWLILSDWQGNNINYEQPELYPIIEITTNKQMAEQRIKQLEARAAELEDENIALIRREQQFRERYEKLLGFDKGRYEVIPKETLGMQMSDTTVKTKPKPEG